MNALYHQPLSGFGAGGFSPLSADVLTDLPAAPVLGNNGQRQDRSARQPSAASTHRYASATVASDGGKESGEAGELPNAPIFNFAAALDSQRPSLQAPYISSINLGEIPGRNGANRLNPRARKPKTRKRAGLICKALAFLAAPAAAAPVCHFGSPGTTVSIAPGDETFATLKIHNRLSVRKRTFCTVTLWNVPVTVEYQPGPGALPDWFYVAVPPGFVAIPPKILIDDEAFGDVLIVLDKGFGS